MNPIPSPVTRRANGAGRSTDRVGSLTHHVEQGIRQRARRLGQADIPAETLAAQLAALLDRADELPATLDFQLTTRRALILVLAIPASVGVDRVRAAVESLAGTPWHAPLRRLRHRRVTYPELRRLAELATLYQLPSRNRAMFELRAHARDALTDAIDRGLRAQAHAPGVATPRRANGAER